MWVYDNKITITGGGNHVLKTSESDFRSKKLDFERREKELRTDSFTANEEADRVWHVIQKVRMKRK